MLAKATFCHQKLCRKWRFSLAAFFLSVFTLHPVWADDTEIYFNTNAGSSVKPNLLFMLDATISMDNYDCADGSRTRNLGGCGADDLTPNATATRLERMKAAMTQVLDSLPPDYNVGLMRFGGFDGGRIIYPVSDLAEPGVKEGLNAAVDEIVTVLATPSVGALEEVYRYFYGKEVKHGLRRPLTVPNRSTSQTPVSGLTPERYSRVSHQGSHTGTVIRPPGCDGSDLNDPACAGEYVADGAKYVSPIASECQSNYAVMLTDGGPWVGWGGTARLTDVYNDTISFVQSAPINAGTCENVGVAGKCGQELAAAMRNGDASADLPGQQYITTHTIGFNISNDWIKDVASSEKVFADADDVEGTFVGGGGSYFEADSADDLIGAIDNIVSSVVDTGTTIVQPTVTIDQFTRLSHREDVYLALFKPQLSANWVGNLKKYTFSGADPTLKDKDGNTAVDTVTGEFLDTSTSFWTDTPDGSDILLGGAAGRLDMNNRRIVSNLDVATNPSLLSAGDPNRNEIAADNTFLTPQLLGISEAPAGAAAAAGQVCYLDWTTWAWIGTTHSGFRTCTGVRGLTNFSNNKRHNNDIGAISVGTGVHTIIYDGQNGAGESLCVTSDTDSNILGSMRNRATSFEVGLGECPDSFSAAPSREKLLAWLKGKDIKDDDGDGDTTDARHHIGDPLHSNPTVVTYGEAGATADEVTASSLVFFGTNEGFLHAIDTETGDEEYAFMPRELLSQAGILFSNNTLARNEIKPYGLDGDITLRVIDNNNNGLIESGSDVAQLYVGMRRGGRNYYSLDVSSKADPKFKWSILGGSGDFTELGQTWSKPIPTKIKVGTDASKDVLVFGGGYDPAQDDTNIRSADTMGRAIYIIDADTGALIWSGGKYGATTPSAKHYDFSDMDYSIPANLAVVNDQQTGYMSQIYVGDMGGQLWRFDINNGSVLDDLVDGGVIANFAGDTARHARRFYASPDLSLSKEDGELKMNIAIGSGYRAHPLNEKIDDRFFVVRYPYKGYGDNYGRKVTVGTTDSYPVITELDLYDATDNLVAEGDDTDAEREDLADAEGWYIDLEDSGEKVLDQSSTFQGVVRFVSYVPGMSAGPCDPNLGTSFFYAVNLLDGTPFEDLHEGEPDSYKKDFRKQEVPTPGIAAPVSTIFVKNEGNGTITPTDVSGVNKIYEWDDVSRPRRWFWAEVPD